MRSARPLQAAAFVLLAGGVWLTGSHLEARAQAPYDVSVVPRASVMRWLSLGHPTLAANLFWLRTVQYVGEPRAEQRGWEKLYPLADLVTDLDPGHGYVYQVVGVLLGSLGQVAESNAILEKGIRNTPNRYILPYLRAFNAFYYEDDWPAAGRWAAVSAKTPGAPPHVFQNVTAYYVKGRRADAAIAFLEQSLAEARDPDTRAAVEKQLRQARLEAVAQPLEDAAAAWRERYVGGPLALEQLVEEGLVPDLPPDPYGGELFLDGEGRVRSSAHEFRFKPPTPFSQRRPEPGVRR
jgi:tetratricopeptide (TPR) repeat protein